LAQPCCDLPPWPNAVLAQLPNGFTLELCPAAHQWWSEAARVLRAGKLVAIDYGFASEPWETPEREHGTLRAYHRHLIAPDVLANPGEQDITAHVNFYALRQAGEASGLSTESFVTQEQFLTSIAAPTFQVAASFGDWTLARIRQFQTLTHPAHLGHSFRVLVQSANGP
jgi:SAM-dependent MidA family methyltransferase